MASSNGCAQDVTAAYIENMLGELRSMSMEINADFLVYLLEMAMIEAGALAKVEKGERIPVVGHPDAEDLARMYAVGEL